MLGDFFFFLFFGVGEVVGFYQFFGCCQKECLGKVSSGVGQDVGCVGDVDVFFCGFFDVYVVVVDCVICYYFQFWSGVEDFIVNFFVQYCYQSIDVFDFFEQNFFGYFVFFGLYFNFKVFFQYFDVVFGNGMGYENFRFYVYYCLIV